MKVLIIVPTYNERDNLPVLVGEVLSDDRFHVLVVDDQSPDDTGIVADQLARKFAGRVEVMHRSGPRGLGRAYRDGIKLALEGDADLICQMDADLSHDPKYLADIVAAAERHDLVIGSRYLHGVSVVNWPLWRLFLSTFANRYIRVVTRLPVRDCTSGFRCWRREALARIQCDRVASDGYAYLIEMLSEAVRTGCRIGEVPIVFVERREGQSKLSTGVLIESVLTPWRILWKKLVS